MRIDGNQRVTVAGRGPAARGTSSSAFIVDEGGPAASGARPAGGVSAPASIGALLALQSVEDPLLKRRRLVRRGNQLIDALEDLRADLLLGRISEGRLNQLMAVLSQARERAEPGLDVLIDDIELRARVELAKRGLFPA
ncbi:MAG: flagellar assembly protein FliX [Devosia sp.]|nr:flagellar assembly protein FliX [Devosia sp.]